MKVLIEVDLDELEYPDLFSLKMVGTERAFPNLSYLSYAGFKPVNSVSPSIVTLFHKNGYGLSSDFFNNVFIKNFFTYKIMVIVSKLDNNSETNCCYHVTAAILLDHNGDLYHTGDKEIPSIVFYRRQGSIGKYLDIIVSHGYAIFKKDYYYFTDIVDYDEHLSEYDSEFRDYDHNKLATTTSDNSNISDIKLRYSNFYSNENSYNPNLLSEFFESNGSQLFIDWLNVRLSLNKDQVKILSMLTI